MALPRGYLSWSPASADWKSPLRHAPDRCATQSNAPPGAQRSARRGETGWTEQGGRCKALANTARKIVINALRCRIYWAKARFQVLQACVRALFNTLIY